MTNMQYHTECRKTESIVSKMRNERQQCIFSPLLLSIVLERLFFEKNTFTYHFFSIALRRIYDTTEFKVLPKPILQHQYSRSFSPIY